MESEPTKVIASQNEGHGEGHDYVKGSPHLRHDGLRSMIESKLQELVRESIAREGACQVLEIGAGHGTFTQFLLDAGATVTVTEASEASATILRKTYADQPAVKVFFDRTGESVFDGTPEYDAVVCASLLHHIPDYMDFVQRLAHLVRPGGWFYSVQDPTYYPRRSRATHLFGRGTYYVWRLGQGHFRRGISTRVRHLRGIRSDTNPSDTIEYHVMREGVDELALAALLEDHFTDVELFTYWSTQSPLFQRMFAHAGLPTDFGLIARARHTA